MSRALRIALTLFLIALSVGLPGCMANQPPADPDVYYRRGGAHGDNFPGEYRDYRSGRPGPRY